MHDFFILLLRGLLLRTLPPAASPDRSNLCSRCRRALSALCKRPPPLRTETHASGPTPFSAFQTSVPVLISAQLHLLPGHRLKTLPSAPSRGHLESLPLSPPWSMPPKWPLPWLRGSM